MAGIVFLGTKKIKEVSEFYTARAGCVLWLDQGGCRVFKHGNMLLGFCGRDFADICGIITFFFETDREVDGAYRRLEDIATTKPKFNPKYDIYHFFATDPEGRVVEFQSFRNKIDHDFGID